MRRNFLIASVFVPLVCFLLFKFQDGDFILMIYEKIGQDPAVGNPKTLTPGPRTTPTDPSTDHPQNKIKKQK